MPGASDDSIAFDGKTLVIRRRLNAPRELVFSAWTEPEHLLHWFCPKGFAVLQAQADVRPGGRWWSRIRSPGGELFEERGVYREVAPPEKLVFTHAWITPDGKPPVETLITVDFTEDRDATAMTFTQVGLPSIAHRASHGQGWSEAFDTLAGHLADQSKFEPPFSGASSARSSN